MSIATPNITDNTTAILFVQFDPTFNWACFIERVEHGNHAVCRFLEGKTEERSQPQRTWYEFHDSGPMPLFIEKLRGVATVLAFKESVPLYEMVRPNGNAQAEFLQWLFDMGFKVTRVTRQ